MAANSVVRFWGLLLCLFFLATFLISRRSSSRSYVISRSVQERLHNKSGNISTVREFDLNDAEKKVYKPLGYEVLERTEPIARIRKVDRPTCDKVFEDWLAVAKTYRPNVEPIRAIPSNLYDAFTLFGQSYIKSWYFDDRSELSSTTWKKEEIDKLWHSQSTIPTPYGDEGTGIYNAMKDYPLKGTKGLVVGSLTPWVEAYCLKCGAEKVITLEYKRIVSEHPKVDYLHPVEMALEWKKHKGEFDFIASFSSIEHSGLGRYGDALDPIGDLRELQKIRCLLKEGGYLFLGIPTGADGIYYNAHRIYGRARLPMMFDGFKLLNVYYGRQTKPVSLNSGYFEHENGAQYVFALQKVDD